MAYVGQVAELRLGSIGLMYDMAQQDLPINALIRSENVQYYNGIIEKADQINDWMLSNPSYSTPAFSGEIPLAVKRYNPTPSLERQIVVTDTGNVYKYLNPFVRTLVTATGSAPATLSVNGQPMIVNGGAEDQGKPKKMFVFSGNSPIQVIEADGITRRNLTTPAADWSSSYPSNGVIFRNRLIAYGNANDRHRVYISVGNNQEDFTGIGFSTISVFPGEGEGLLAHAIYKGRLFFFKKPYGVYYLVSDDPSPTNWYVQKVSSSVGIASPTSFFEAGDDVYFLSSDGTISSFSAALRLGDIYQADLLANLKTDSIFRNIMRKQFLYTSFGGYLPQKKIGVFGFASFKSSDGKPDCFVHIDFNNQQAPRVSWHRYLEHRFTCVDYYKDQYGEDKLLFGKVNYSNGVIVDSVMGAYYPNYGEDVPFRFQTPHMDFGTNANKLFDFVELEFESTAAQPLALDVYIDSKFSQTITIQPYFGSVLSPQIFGPSTPQYTNPEFTLDTSYLSGRGSRVKMKRLNRRGQTISFVVRDGNVVDPNSGEVYPDDDSGSTYPYKIVGIKVYYRVAGQDQKLQTN